MQILLESKLNAIGNPNHLVYLGFGSNINPHENLPKAIALINKNVEIVEVSSIYKTQAIGTEGPDFLNAVVLIKTHLLCDDLKSTVIRNIEDELGRVRTSDKNAPRTIDIDILIEDDELYDEDVWAQAHLAIPLAELYPGYTHPVTNERLIDIAKNLEKTHIITKQHKSLSHLLDDSPGNH